MLRRPMRVWGGDHRNRRDVSALRASGGCIVVGSGRTSHGGDPVRPRREDERNEFGILLRDCYCTPEWFCELLPEVDLDPCSNPRSHIAARRTYQLEHGEDGLKLSWSGSVFLNPPYSNLDPWAERLYDEMTAGRVTDAGVLVNVDTSTYWWRAFTHVARCQLALYRRVSFDAPPGVTLLGSHLAMNPQALIATPGFRAACDRRIDAHGAWWKRDP